MNKDKITSVRINSEILKKLKKMNLSPQKLLDEGVKKYFKIINTIEIITKKRGK